MRTTRDAIERLERSVAHDEYLESISPFRDATGYWVPAEFVFATGRRP